MERWQNASLEEDGKRYFDGNAYIFTEIYVDDTKLAGKQDHVPNVWAIPEKKVHLEDPTLLLDQENLGCTQREVQVKELYWRSRSYLHNLTPPVLTKPINVNKDIQVYESNKEDITEWGYEMPGHAPTCVPSSRKSLHISWLRRKHFRINKCRKIRNLLLDFFF